MHVRARSCPGADAFPTRFDSIPEGALDLGGNRARENSKCRRVAGRSGNPLRRCASARLEAHIDCPWKQPGLRASRHVFVPESWQSW